MPAQSSIRKGWFCIDGVQDGDRTLAEQMMGLERVLAEVPGKRVLDMGCAEGLITREIARAGAAHVHGFDVVAEHIEEARKQCAGLANVTFSVEHLGKIAPPAETFDIVLALGVCHKLPEPKVGVRYAALAGRGLVLVRMSRRMHKRTEHVLHSKRGSGSVNVTEEMARHGFTLEAIDPGPREETVHYYRK